MSISAPPPSAHRRLIRLLALLIAVAGASLLFRRPLQQVVLLRSLLRADSPWETAFQELADGTKDPFPFLDRVWNTQEIPHRAMVATYLKENSGSRPGL